MNDKREISLKIKEIALETGFEMVGITTADKLPDIDFYKSWIENGFAGEMDYLKRNIEKRENPALLLPNTKSVVCVGLNYYQGKVENKEYKIAGYALGNDYHIFLKDKLQLLLKKIKEIIPEVEGRAYVDTAPVLERALAKRAGLGWIGNNTLLINPKKGSYYLLGELFLDIELEYDDQIKDFCGNCTRCLDACPTNALIEPKVLDSNLCLSYLTIELKDNIPENIAEKTGNNLFGCDICQDVCPWNKKFAEISKNEEFKPRKWLTEMTLEEISEISQEQFSKLFKESPIKRAKRRGFLRNVIAVLSSHIKNNHPERSKYIGIMKKLTNNDEELVRNQAELFLAKE